MFYMGLRPGFAALSPGSLLIAAMIDDAIAGGCPEVEFLRGDEATNMPGAPTTGTTWPVGWRQPSHAATERTAQDRDDPITLCLDGQISAPMMLARLALAGLSDAAMEQALTARAGAEPLLAFFRAHANSLQQVRATAAQVDHTVGASPAEVAARFDAAVSRGPEISVAAYRWASPNCSPPPPTRWWTG